MKKVKEHAPHVKAAQIEKEAVRALSVDEVEEALTKSTYGGTEEDVPPLDDMVGGGDPEALVREISRLNEYLHVLKAECLALKDENKKYLREIDDYKKTISKMKQHHEAEVQDLKDQLGEAKAEANAIRKHKDDILKKHTEYADALDNDSVAFEEILGLAIILERSAKSMQEMSKMLQEKTEGKV